jgi:hypothetical protein
VSQRQANVFALGIGVNTYEGEVVGPRSGKLPSPQDSTEPKDSLRGSSSNSGDRFSPTELANVELVFNHNLVSKVCGVDFPFASFL